MRQRLLDRLEFIKKEQNGFRGPGRWATWFFNPNCWERAGKKHKSDVHLSELQFGQVPDEQLLVIFEAIIRRKNTQM